MKKMVRQRIAREKRGIERRLKAAVAVNDGGPVLRGGNIEYELSVRTSGIAHGGMGAVQRVVRRIGLAEAINANVSVLKIHKPYQESDHVLNIAYNVLCGGERLEDIELRRNDRVMLNALGDCEPPTKPGVASVGRYLCPHVVLYLIVMTMSIAPLWIIFGTY